MNKKKLFISLIPLLAFVFIAVFLWRGLHANPSDIPSPLIGKKAPPFAGANLQNETKIITNKSLLGHVTLLNVFATWCTSCRAEHAVLLDIPQEKRFKVYGLNYKDEKIDALHWLKQYGNPYNKIIFDPEGKIGIDFGVYGTPETFIIDPKGVVRYKHVGPISPSDLQNEILPEVAVLEKQ